ncbi:hypothetical protein PX52LOC_01520 [Limnoglobus roseus]|uniref:Uncharacterized protein n=2 Tax=Limnoglobus roseus TaxID=2598579 RepID=A0A5C1AC76_9BACT|nr:hypothetical protein PX52LOC_01520 [Limnoglobus roseus]
MCSPSIPLYRRPDLRQRAAELRAQGLKYVEIAKVVGGSVALVQRLLAPMPPLIETLPRPMWCRHCGRAKVNRPKGLCWTCSMSPAIRERYGPISPNGRRGVPAPRGNRPKAEPTTATPGSDAKIEVLAQRAERGERLWHPRDHQAEGSAKRVEVRVCRVAIQSR